MKIKGFIQAPAAGVLLFLALTGVSRVCLADEKSDLSAKIKEAFTQNTNYDATIENCNKLMPFDPVGAHLFRGWAYHQKHEDDKAVADLNEVIRLKPNAYAHELRGDIFSGKNDHEKAVDEYSEAINLNPKKGSLYISRASEYVYGKNLDAARVDCSTAVLLLSDVADSEHSLAEAFCLRGEIFSMKGDLARSFEDYSAAIKLDPKNALAFSGRGRIYIWKKDYASGIAEYYKSINISTNNSVTYCRLAWVLAACPDAKIRDGQRALEYAKKAYDLTVGEEPHCFAILAVAYAEVRNFEEAIKWEKNYIESKPAKDALKMAQEQLSLFNQKKPYRLDK